MATGIARFTDVERSAVDACLQRILVSAPFAQSERLQRFLKFVVTETLAGQSDRLKGYTIGIEVFDREPSFDSSIDAIVRVEAARLRSKLREYYEGDGREDPVRIGLPKGGYAAHIEVRGPRVASAATATNASAAPDALTAPGMPAARDVPTAANAPAARTATAANAPTAPTSSFVSSLHPPPVEDKPSLAVLPFTNLSSDAEQGYFADGVTDSLITELSRLPGLFVISRHSSFFYRNLPKRADEIGAELGVKYLVEGSVRRAGNKVRITTQLVDAASGRHIWAERFDRELQDLFAVEDDVVRRILAVLQVKLAGPGTSRTGHEGTRSLEAHDCLLRGLERLWLSTRECVGRARVYFARAVDLDATYATAHAWLARALVFEWIMYWDPRPEGVEGAFEHARLAVDLDSQLPQAQSILCWVQLWRRQADAAIEAGSKAVAMDPNDADAHVFLSSALCACGRGKEALPYIEKGMRLNPHPSGFYYFALGQCYYVLEDYEKALAAFQQGVALRDVFYPNHYHLCLIYTLFGQEAQARTERDILLKLTGDRKPILRSIYLDEHVSKVTDELACRAGLLE